MGIYVIVHDNDFMGYVVVSSLSAAKKKINTISRNSDGYQPTAEEFDNIEEVKRYN